MDKQHEILEKMKQGNALFVAGGKMGDVSKERRLETKTNGQHPYAVIVTCSDSRVPPEYIFSAGIGDLFVIRTAGNVVGGLELGSIEYGVEHLGAEVVVILGHTCCGAVAAALEGHTAGEDHIGDILDEIIPFLGSEHNPTRCSEINVRHGVSQVMECSGVKGALVVGGIYDIESGKVDFLADAGGIVK